MILCTFKREFQAALPFRSKWPFNKTPVHFWGGTGHPDTEIRGRGGGGGERSQNIFFGPSGLSLA